jgi:hypothetical protein
MAYGYFDLLSQHLAEETKEITKNVRMLDIWAKNRTRDIQNKEHNPVHYTSVSQPVVRDDGTGGP